MHADENSVGAHLDIPGSRVQALLQQATRLEIIQKMLRDWLHEPLANSLRVVNERASVLVVFIDSAAACTQIRYRQQEMQQFLQDRLGQPALRLEIRMRPASQETGSIRV